jgi:hypothetical protein
MISAIGNYVLGILIGFDVTANAIIGGAHYMTISARIGLSIKAGGWASKVPWPAWWVRHCMTSVYMTVV